MKIYNYRNLTSALFGLVPALLAAVPTFIILGSHGDDFGSLVVDAVVLSFFWSYPAYVLLKFINERIVVDDESITWISWFGFKKARILRANIKATNYGSFNHGFGFGFSVRSDEEVIRFSFNLKDLGRLLDTIRASYGPASPPRVLYPEIPSRTFQYPAEWSRPYVLFGLTLFYLMMLSFGGREDHIVDPGLIRMPTFYFVLGLAMTTYFGMRAQYERVKLQDGFITWVNWRGRTRIRVPYDQLIPGSMTWSGPLDNACFQVETAMGPIKWNSKIVGGNELAEYMRILAHQPDLPLPMNFFKAWVGKAPPAGIGPKP